MPMHPFTFAKDHRSQRVLRPRRARPDHQGSGTSPDAEMDDLVLPTLAASADAE